MLLGASGASFFENLLTSKGKIKIVNTKVL